MANTLSSLQGVLLLTLGLQLPESSSGPTIRALPVRELLRVGRTSLVIGLVALAAAIGLGDFLATLLRGSRVGEVVRERLTIGGWVSMWRPLEVFLYDWWPIRNEARLSDRLAVMPIRIRYANAIGPDAWRAGWPAVSPVGQGKTIETQEGPLNRAS